MDESVFPTEEELRSGGGDGAWLSRGQSAVLRHSSSSSAGLAATRSNNEYVVHTASSSLPVQSPYQPREVGEAVGPTRGSHAARSWDNGIVAETDPDGATPRWRPLVPEHHLLQNGTALPQPWRAPSATDSHTGESVSSTEAERRFIDEFGFVIDENAKAQDERYIRNIDDKQVARREVKWADMAADWERTNTRKFDKLKERCRKGIPSRFRGVAWQLLLSSRHEMNAPGNVGVYVALRAKQLADKEVDATIARDRARTFPNHVLFQADGGVGQRFLCNVLHAYAACDPEVGYVQGMAFLVAALSTQMGEEECFWALHSMMYSPRYLMRELFKPGFPRLQQFFYQLKCLLDHLLPRLSRRFAELSVDPSFYASQWFLTLFVYHFPFRSLLRIWDIFFCEGWKIIFRTAIALMKWEEERLLSLPFEELLPALKRLQDGKDMKQLMQRALRVKFKTADLIRYGDEYWQTGRHSFPQH